MLVALPLPNITEIYLRLLMQMALTGTFQLGPLVNNCLLTPLKPLTPPAATYLPEMAWASPWDTVAGGSFELRW